MTYSNPLLAEIEDFLSKTDMGETYFGKKSTGNSELVARLKAGGDVRMATAAKVRDFIKSNSPSSKSAPLSEAS